MDRNNERMIGVTEVFTMITPETERARKENIMNIRLPFKKQSTTRWRNKKQFTIDDSVKAELPVTILNNRQSFKNLKNFVKKVTLTEKDMDALNSTLGINPSSEPFSNTNAMANPNYSNVLRQLQL